MLFSTVEARLCYKANMVKRGFEVETSERQLLVELEKQIFEIRPRLSEKRRPFILEFAGTPKSGKTTTINAVHQFFKRNGVVVRTFQERASVAPLVDKGTAFFNTWVTCATLNGIIEALEDEKLDVLILDRGLFDGLVWIDWQEKTHRVSQEEAQGFRGFVLTPRWRGLVDMVFVMHCDPRTSLDREYANQITLRHGAIMNEATLAELRQHYLLAAKRYQAQFKSVTVIENSRGSAMNTISKIAKTILNSLGRFADEEVLCLPRKSVEGQLRLSENKVVTPNWRVVSKLVNVRGNYVRRSVAEASDNLFQVVPVCVIRNGDRFLTNKRYEPGESLHEAFGNWAGGHVRKQDLDTVRSKWESVEAGLRRELHEELSLEDLPPLKPIGIVHSSEDKRAARHIGIVFEAVFRDPANIAAFDNKTIRERPNRYVTTSWMERKELSRTLHTQRDWSRAISNYLVEA
jgi:predicted NUDIX family phosphoesterase/thymidylate kinase